MISQTKQQMILGCVAAVLLLSNLFLSIRVFKQDRTVILVPTIDTEMVIGANFVSENYLHVRAEQIMQLLFNIRRENFSYNTDQILKQVFSGSKSQFKEQLDIFIKDIKFKRYFYVFRKTAFAINASKLEVVFDGHLDVFVNDKKIKTERKSYKLVFANNYGLVKLLSFQEVTDDRV